MKIPFCTTLLIFICFFNGAASAGSNGVSLQNINSQFSLYLGTHATWGQVQDDLSQGSGGMTAVGSGLNINLEAAKAIAPNQRLGVAVQMQWLDRSKLMWGASEIALEANKQHSLLFIIRALNYQYQFNSIMHGRLFMGAGSWDLNIATIGYVLGTGMGIDLTPSTSIIFEVQYSDKLARDNLLEHDNKNRPDTFYDLVGVNFMVGWRF